MSKRVNQIAKDTGVKWQTIVEIINEIRRPQNNPNLPELKNHANTLVFGEEELLMAELNQRGLIGPKAPEEPAREVSAPVPAAVVSTPAPTPPAPVPVAAPVPKAPEVPAPVVVPAPAPVAPAVVPAVVRPGAPPPLAPPPAPRGPNVMVPPRGVMSGPPSTPPLARPSSPQPVSAPPVASTANRPPVVSAPPSVSAPRPAGPPPGAVPPRPPGMVPPSASQSRPSGPGPAPLPGSPPPAFRPPVAPAAPVGPQRVAPPVQQPSHAFGRPGLPPGVSAGRSPSNPLPQQAQASGPAQPRGELKLLALKAPIIVRDFAEQLGMRPFKLISELMDLGIFASMNASIDDQVAVRVAERHGILLEVRHRGGADEKKKAALPPPPKVDADDPKFLVSRPPIVCILGHVDHGKTTLLDTIRNTSVVKGEFGGITQHIGAYQVEKDGQKITFIDTPGHAAFSNMRARGADVTDIAVLVVAADDGFMPQTMEALQHARNHNVPVIVAINKIDAKGANIERVKKQMQERNLTPEDWGGETLTCPVSAIKGEGIENLLANILVQAEIMELKSNPTRPPEGVIMETQKEIGRGSTSSVIVEKGTLRVGDSLVCGPVWCRVRSLVNDKGVAIKEAPPATPVKVIGWSDTPESGHIFKTVKNEKAAREEAEENAFLIRQEAAQAAANEAEAARPDERRLSNDEAMALLFGQKDKKIVFKVLVKSDVYGTAEALGACLEGIESTKITCEIVDIGVGPLNKNDVVLAHSAGATVVCFNVGKENGITPLLKQHSVPYVEHNIIYHMIDLVKDAMADRLPPETKEVKLGVLEIRGVFPLGKGFVAGGLVTEGLLKRDARARVLRKNKVLADSRINTLKRLKDEVNEVRAGLECGLGLDTFDGYQMGDTIEAYEIQKIRASL